jgi:TatD DNase family protein
VFVDSHCHLDCLENPEEALAEARKVGISTFLTIGVRYEDVAPRLQLIQAHSDVFMTIGIHPCYVGETSLPSEHLYEAFKARIEEIPRIIGIGETGLDLAETSPPLSLQKQYLWQQMRLALDLDIPVILHLRYAEKEMEELFCAFEEAFGSLPPHIFHCFTGSLEYAQKAISRGATISFSGILTFPKAEEVHRAAEHLPLSCLCLETDSPWLAPVPYRGKPNQPAFLIKTAQALAALKGLPLEEVAAQTTKNFFKLFRKARPS